MSPSSANSFAVWRTRLNALALGGQGRERFMFYTYVLRCFDVKRNRIEFYTGHSEKISDRIEDHIEKSVKTTKSFNEIVLVYYEACLNKTDAIKRERQLKTGFGRGYIKKRIENYLKETRD